MFKLNIPVVKSYVNKKANVLTIEWIATDSSIDRDSERFSDDAVKSMHDSVNEWGIPIKVEHWDNIFSEIGVWKEANFTEDWKVFVKWEVDLDLSMWKDIEVLLSKWFDIALSVWWMVKDAISEFNSELWKSIKIYTDILLKEISIVKNPANYNATLSLAKSFDFKNKKETLAGISLNEDSIVAHKSLNKSVAQAEDLIKSTLLPTDSVFIKGEWDTKVANYDESPVEYYDSYSISELKYLDYKIIGSIFRIYAAIGTDEIKQPEWLDWETEMNLPDYSFLPLQCDNRLIPYMDVNLKLKKDWIIYGMYRLAKGEYSWINANDRNYAMEFLYSAYKQLLVAEKSTNHSEVRDIRGDEIDLMKSCIKFKTTKGARPQFEGNDLSDTEINKLAKAYSVLIDRNILKTNSNKTMNEAELKILIAKYTEDLAKLEVTKSETTVEAPVEEVVEAPVKEVVEAPVEEVIETPITKEEAPVEEVKVEEVKVEEAPVVVEETPVVEETTVVEDTNTNTTEKKTSIDEALLTAITAAVETANKSTADSIVALEKSMDEKIDAIKTVNEEAMTKSVSKTTNLEKANSEAMEKMAWTLKTISDKVEVIGKSKGDRKSFATSIAKGYTEKDANKSQEDLITAEMEKNGNSYARARSAVLGAE